MVLILIQHFNLHFIKQKQSSLRAVCNIYENIYSVKLKVKDEYPIDANHLSVYIYRITPISLTIKFLTLQLCFYYATFNAYIETLFYILLCCLKSIIDICTNFI